MDAFFGLFFSVFFSSKCLSCDENLRYFGFCPSCWRNLEPRRGSRCRVCDAQFAGPVADSRCGQCLDKPPPFDQVHGLFDYAGPVGDAIRKGKYGDCPRAITMVAKLCALALRERMDVSKSMTIVPIPSHWRRAARQRFEPTLVIAHELSLELNMPLNKRLLNRKTHTKPQAGMKAIERSHNLKGAFKATDRSPKRVLLVDDVYTTGATVKSATRVLKRSGAEDVQVLAAAYVT